MSNYQKAEELLNKYIKNDNLKKHCYGVAACMKTYSQKLDQNVEQWEITGLLHDIDWETNPDTHPNTAVPILKEAGFDQDMIDAILGHAYPARTDVSRVSLLAKYLFACDELSGFITAYSLMKGGDLNAVEPKSIIKKLKDKAFARGVSRDDIRVGVEEIGVPVEVHVATIIEALKTV